MLPHTLRYFFSITALTIRGSYFEKCRNRILLMGNGSAKSISHSPDTTTQARSDPSPYKSRSGWNRWLRAKKEQETWSRGGMKSWHFYMKWEEEEVDALCSCFCFIFLKLALENNFKKVLTCPGNKPFARSKDRWLFPLLPPPSCCFCPPAYLLLFYTLQLLFAALSCFPALSAFGYIQLHHPTHSLQNSSFHQKSPTLSTQKEVWSPALKDSHAPHTSTHHPSTHKPIWTACCPI